VKGRLSASTAVLALIALLSLSSAATLAQPADLPLGLVYDALTRGPVPIPPGERGVQTVIAAPWFKVSSEALALEGAPRAFVPQHTLSHSGRGAECVCEFAVEG
jgi:hypothetical protein